MVEVEKERGWEMEVALVGVVDMVVKVGKEGVVEGSMACILFCSTCCKMEMRHSLHAMGS